MLTFDGRYNKWAGGDKYDAYNAKEKSQSRVDIAKDSGYTRADGGNNAFICMFFARGCCPKGRDCEYLHRLPGPSHKLPDYSCDVFGRPKHADYRDDMGGVGSFNRMNRTLYVGKIKATRDVENIVERHFEEFGPIEKSRPSLDLLSNWNLTLHAVKILQSRGIGFVTYVHEISAQFAKEAMSNQSLDNEEVLNVRCGCSLFSRRDVDIAAVQMGHRRSQSNRQSRGGGPADLRGRTGRSRRLDRRLHPARSRDGRARRGGRAFA